MKSRIAERIQMQLEPVALLWTDEEPENALQFGEGRRGCVVSLICSAAKGRTAYACLQTAGCTGGAVGLGLTSSYEGVPGGIEYFLSNGNPEFCCTPEGRELAKKNPHLEHGEGYFRSPDVARAFIQELPRMDLNTKYVVFKPLSDLTPTEEPKVVIFLANPDQLSGLVTLCCYTTETRNAVVVSMAAGCAQMGILAYREVDSDQPRAILGLTDASARVRSANAIGRDKLSFTIPWNLFKRMEADVDNCFLVRGTWEELMGSDAPSQ